MSHDFALPSLDISDGSALRMNQATNQAEFRIDQLKMRRRWENDGHRETGPGPVEGEHRQHVEEGEDFQNAEGDGRWVDER